MKKRDYIKAIILDATSFCFLLLTFGFWIVKPTEETLLNLHTNTIYFLSSFFLGVVFFTALYKKKIETMGSSLFETKKIGAEISQKPFFSKFINIQRVLVFGVACVAGVQATELNAFELFSPDGFAAAQRIFVSLFTPNFDILPEAVLKIIETLFMAFMATVLAVPLAFVLSFLAAKNIMSHNSLSFFILQSHSYFY